MNDIYTPMERILIEGAKRLTAKEECEQALETKKQLFKSLELDLALLEAEEKFGLMDGIRLEEEWIL